MGFTCPAHLVLLEFIIPTISGKQVMTLLIMQSFLASRPANQVIMRITLNVNRRTSTGHRVTYLISIIITMLQLLIEQVVIYVKPVRGIYKQRYSTFTEGIYKHRYFNLKYLFVLNTCCVLTIARSLDKAFHNEVDTALPCKVVPKVQRDTDHGDLVFLMLQ
jgi:hypothetical protein